MLLIVGLIPPDVPEEIMTSASPDPTDAMEISAVQRASRHPSADTLYLMHQVHPAALTVDGKCLPLEQDGAQSIAKDVSMLNGATKFVKATRVHVAAANV
jgi:hypothetical protein